MFKNQLQELAQRTSGRSMPLYSCTKDGPDHSPKFKASVNVNGETFESPGYFTTRKQAEQAAAESAYRVLSDRAASPSGPAGPSKIVEDLGGSKNSLQAYAQRAGMDLPEYRAVKSGPDHACQFKASVHFNGETFESDGYFRTRKLAEQSAADISVKALKSRMCHDAPFKILEDSHDTKNLLQEYTQRTGIPLPEYNTIKSGPDHEPVFVSKVTIAAMQFTGDTAKTKKEAEKSAALAAYTALSRANHRGA